MTNNEIKAAIEIIGQHPYIDAAGVAHDKFVRYTATNGCYIRQVETGQLYVDAVDAYPCLYHYVETDIPIPVETESPDEEIGDETAQEWQDAETPHKIA